MATITVLFVGICTHLAALRRGDKHRVVVLNATDGDPTRGIKPHHAKLIFGPHGEHVLPLNGVTLRIEDEDIHTVNKYERSYTDCIPPLTHYTHEPIKPDDNVTRGEHLNLVHAYFDFTGGVFSGGFIEKHCAVTSVSVTTSAQARLRVEKFGSHVVEHVPLDDKAIIQVQNINDQKQEEDEDFLLHFCITGHIPKDAHPPHKHEPRCNDIALICPVNTVGPGCSNSTYP